MIPIAAISDLESAACWHSLLEFWFVPLENCSPAIFHWSSLRPCIVKVFALVEYKRRKPDSLTVMNWWSDAPPTSCTLRPPFRARIFLLLAPRQNPVSSAFQILEAKSGTGWPCFRRPCFLKKFSTVANQLSNTSGLPAATRFADRCWGFRSDKEGHLFKNCRHQSGPGTPSLKGDGLFALSSSFLTPIE